MLYHMNCPRYPESKLVRRPLYKYRLDYLFVTFVDSRWVLEIRFGSHKSQIDSQLYTCRALHCLRGSPGIGTFVGVVVDERSGLVTAYLTELPGKGALSYVMAKADSTNIPISWIQRVMWSKQIVQAVRGSLQRICRRLPGQHPGLWNWN